MTIETLTDDEREQRDAEIAQLTAERDALVEAVQRRDQGIADIRAEVARLTEALAAAERAEDVRVRAVQDDYSARLAAAQASHEQTCGERHEAAKRAEAAEQKLAAAEQRVAELESVDERGLLGTRISDLESEVMQLREDKRNTGNKPPRGPALQYANPSTYRIEPFELEVEVARLTESLAEMRQKRDTAREHAVSAESRAEAAEQKRAAVEAQCRRLGEDVQALRNELAAAEKARIEELGRWEQKLAAANWLLESAAALLSAPEWLKKAVKVHLSGQPVAPDPHDASVALVCERMVEAQVDAVELQAEVARLTEALAAAEQRVAAAWTVQWDRANAEWEKRRAAEAKCRELESALEARKSQRKRLRLKLRRAESELAQLRERIQALRQGERISAETIRRLTDACSVVEARCRELESSNAALRNELSRDMQASGESELAQLRERVRELEAELRSVRDGQEPSSITVEYWTRRAKEAESARWAAESELAQLRERVAKALAMARGFARQRRNQ